MKRVCGGTIGRPCGKDMGEKAPLEDPSETTGLCDECLAILAADFERDYPGFLGSIEDLRNA